MSSERKSPDALLVQTNLTGTLSRIQDDPDAPDANWLTTTNNKNTTCHVSFGTPSGVKLITGAGVQRFRCWLRKTNHTTNPTAVINLKENGTLLATLTASTTISSTTGQILQGAFDAALLSDITGAGVECEIVGSRGTGNPGNRASVEIGAVEWNLEYLDAISGTSATTNGNDTQTAAGTTTVVGAAAITNVDDVPTISGAPGGVNQFTLGLDFYIYPGFTTGLDFYFTNDFSTTGTVAVTNANDTSAASGTTTVVIITGEASVMAGDDTSDASGSPVMVGVANIIGEDDTSSSSGEAQTSEENPVQTAGFFDYGTAAERHRNRKTSEEPAEQEAKQEAALQAKPETIPEQPKFDALEAWKQAIEDYSQRVEQERLKSESNILSSRALRAIFKDASEQRQLQDELLQLILIAEQENEEEEQIIIQFMLEL